MISDSGPHPYFRTLIEADPLDRRRLTVGCLGPPGPLQEDMAELGVDSFALGVTSRPAWPGAAVRLARLLRRRKTDIVQTHLVDATLVGLAAARLARTPVAMMTAHHSHELPFHGRKLRAVDTVCAGPLSDAIIAPSESVAETLVTCARASRDKIAVVHHGFDLGWLDPGRASGEAVRAELGLTGKLVFGTVGRFFPLKNQAALVEAFAASLAGMPGAHLLMVGGGDARPISELARTLGIADRVVISGPRPDIPEVLAAFDAFVHPAIAESFGMVIIEAMAMARPVMSTPVGIAPEVIEPGRTGVLAKGTGVEAIAAALRELIALRESWPSMGASARDRVASFTARRMADDYNALYARLLRGAAGRTG